MQVPPRASLPSRAVGRIQAWATAHGVKTMRLCIGVVYFWFGALKFDPVVAVDEAYLPGRVVSALSLGLLDGGAGTLLLAYWECLIGFCLVAGLWLRTASLLMFAHLLIMFLPMVFMPRQVWESFPLVPTVKGRIILDSLVLIACAMMLATSVPRGPPRRLLGPPHRWLRAWDDRATLWMGRHGILMLRLALGALYVWYGALQFLPTRGPLGPLAERTVEVLGLGLIPAGAGVAALGAWEILIGLGLLSGRAPRATLVLILLHLAVAAVPLFAEPSAIWLRYPFALTLAGKFTIRHLALSSAAIVVAASVAQGASGWAARVNPFTGRTAVPATRAAPPSTIR